jgi:tRNA threonylcarbamoyladenosine biosynthesis protein TsaB
MSTVLGIDCSSRKTNAGLVVDGNIIGEINLDLGREQSSRLPFIIEQLLGFHHMGLNSIDRIAVTTGPGYFTGIRVGLSYAIALAEGIGVPVIPVGSLEVLSTGTVSSGCGDIIMPVMWSSQTTVYSSASESTPSGLKSILDPGTYTPAFILSFISDLRSSPILVSPDIEKVSKILPDLADAIVHSGVTGGAVALTGYKNFNRSLDPVEVKATYFREPDIGRPKKPLV